MYGEIIVSAGGYGERDFFFGDFPSSGYFYFADFLNGSFESVISKEQKTEVMVAVCNMAQGQLVGGSGFKFYGMAHDVVVGRSSVGYEIRTVGFCPRKIEPLPFYIVFIGIHDGPFVEFFLRKFAAVGYAEFGAEGDKTGLSRFGSAGIGGCCDDVAVAS